MRLIDAEQLSKHKYVGVEYGRILPVSAEHILAYKLGWNDAIDAIIDNAPTVEKQGHWEAYLSEGLRWKCSECGSRFETPYHYCSNCGAKMYEEVE